MSTATPELHDALRPLAGLLGSFEGPGRGAYPSIDDFRYQEHVTFGHVGKPFLAYHQRTWQPATSAPMHAEVGYLRAPGPDRVELVLAHPTGISEVEQGTWAEDGAGLVVELVTTTIARTDTAKQGRSLRRRFVLDGDALRYDLWMAYADVPETHHLHADLRRQP